jgi:phosphoribosylanthranilate isomerase
MEEIAKIAGLDTAQLHGDEPAADYPAGVAVWKAVRVTAGFDFSQYEQCLAEALLLDGPAAELYGGAGVTFDWSVVGQARPMAAREGGPTGLRIILAGGLDASNVAHAIATAHPWGVDACSRIERAPGRKDYRKMIEFLEAAKAALGQ